MYRAGATIGRALTSVYNQSVVPAEVIVVDDASPDDSVIQAEHAVRTIGIQNTKIIRSSVNGGPAAARNFGWDAASQPWVAFLDADDIWLDGKLGLQMEFLTSAPSAVMLAGRRLQMNAERAAVSPDRSWTQLKFSRLLLSNTVCTSSVIIRRDLSLRFSAEKRYSEDYQLWLEVVRSAKSVWQYSAPVVGAFKPPFGAGGLSGNLVGMAAGELDTYRHLSRQKSIGGASLALLTGLSLTKAAVRIIRTMGRRFS